MSGPVSANPPCPITGRPAVRPIQTTAQRAAGTRLGLWELPCGLIFCDPMIARPGGYLILAMPKFPSGINDIPNFVFSAPPHCCSLRSSPSPEQRVTRHVP